jgi:hypothetical protein
VSLLAPCAPPLAVVIAPEADRGPLSGWCPAFPNPSLCPPLNWMETVRGHGGSGV